MKPKTLIALNVAWLAVAVGAFFIGRSGGGPESAKTSGGLAAPDGSDRRALSALPGDAASPRAGGAPTAGSAGAADVAGHDLSAESVGRRMASALLDSDRIRSQSRIADLLLNLTPQNVDAVLQAFEKGPRNDTTDGHFRDFLYAWARIDGGAALEYARDNASERRTRYGTTTAITGWASVDPDGAKAYVAALEDGESKQWMHYGVFGEILHTNLDEAIVYSEQNGKSRARGRQLDKLADAIEAQRGVAGLREWVEGIDHTDEAGNDLLSYKQYAASVTLDKMAREDADFTREWIIANADQPYLTSGGLERAARRANEGTDRELNWLVELPEMGAKRHAIGEVFEDYIRNDFAAAGQWLAAQPLGPDYDEAIQDYAFSAARDDREAALAWVERISDPKIKSDTLRRIAPAAPTSLPGGDSS